MRNLTIKQILPFVWALFILFATIANTSTLEELSLQSLFAFDKPIHALLFGIQAWLWVRAVSLNPNRLVLICLSTAAYGVLTELLQSWLTTSRTFDMYDMLADGIGCGLVWVIYRRKSVAQ
jgi:VanZ family protein